MYAEFNLFYICIFVVVGCVLSFPLENCHVKKLHFRFLLDCRYDVEDQIKIFNQTKYFFGSEREWTIPQFTLMTYSDKGIYWINESEVTNINQSCPGKFPSEHITNQSQTWSQSQSNSVKITVMFVSLHMGSNELDNTMNNFLKIRKHNFFIILQLGVYNTSKYELSKKYLMSLTSFQEFILHEFYSKLCYNRCHKQPYSFTIGNNLKSYYNVTEQFGMSSNEARQYCAQNENGYLVSFETYDELEFIFQTFGKPGAIIHVGLTQHKHSLFPQWASSNPFTLNLGNNSEWDNDLDADYSNYSNGKRECFLLRSEQNDKENTSNVDSKTAQPYLIKKVFCDKTQEHSLVICECHLPISNNFITMNTQYTEDTYIRRSFIFKFLVMKHSKTELFQLIECSLRSNYTNNSIIKKLCKQYMGLIIKLRHNVTNDFPIMVEKYKKFYFLRPINLSNCYFNDFCQKSETWLKCATNNSSCKDCLDGRLQCFQQFYSSNKQKIKTFTCESTLTDAYFCIKFKNRLLNCLDNSQLQHCENLTCPHNLVKCYNSYCIQPDLVNDGKKDCPHGEDEFIRSKIYDEQCFGNITAYLKDLCVQEHFLYFVIDKIPEKYFCSPACPENYTCFSHRRLNDESIDIFKSHVPLYNISNLYFPELIFQYFPILNIIEFSGQKCNLENFDLAFKNWGLSNLLELDLSYNNLKSSDEMNLIHDMMKLTFLNLSNNPSLRIGDKFRFPERLETIDLSYTLFKSIDGNTFLNLNRLKYLDLSGTEIVGFNDLGIPKLYMLDTLYLQHLKISQIQQDFFAGLTIQTGLWTSDFRLCCPQILNANISVDKCHGPTDAISSCKHLIGDVFKRLVIWIVGIITIVGNGIVLIYRLVWNREIFKKAYGLFVTGLALSDFLMGVYLLIIASVDIDYKDMYVLEETHWRNGMLCQISGFLSTLSSETSTFFICLITLDRYLSITYPFGEYKLSKTLTYVLFTLAWLVGIVLAAVPIVISSWEIYSTNGLCLALPFSSIRFSGWEFTFVVYIGVNFVLFLLIALGQVAIFVHIKRRKQFTSCLKNCRNRRLEDLAVARKLAFVAMSDFLCWFPIGIIGIYSMNGHTFDREVYAWFAVFVLPINSALNPVLYTIPTLYARCKQNIQNTAETKSSSF